MTEADRSRRAAGVILIVISALVFSSAGTFTKGVATDAWGVIFWRGLAAAGFTFAWMAVRGTIRAEVAAFSWPAMLATILMAVGTAAFIPAFKLSSVANVAMIYGAAPFVAAALAWVFIREMPSRRVLLASVVAFGGVLVVVSGSVGSGQLAGDALALWMTLCMAGAMVVYRRWPQTTAALPAALSSVVLLPVAMVFGEPMDAVAREMPVLVTFGLVFAVASVTLSEGARRLPPAETALLSILEMPLAPLLAFLVLSEVAGMRAVIGGAIILAAVVWSQRAGEPGTRVR